MSGTPGADRGDAHRCPGGCSRFVPRSRLACRWCWFRLPSALRQAVLLHYGRDVAAHRAAVLAAVGWFKANPVPRSS